MLRDVGVIQQVRVSPALEV